MARCNHVESQPQTETLVRDEAPVTRRRRLSPSMRARLAALTMHARHPDAASRNGRKGGRTTANNYKDGSRVWATRMALARWHKIPFQYEGGVHDPEAKR